MDSVEIVVKMKILLLKNDNYGNIRVEKFINKQQ